MMKETQKKNNEKTKMRIMKYRKKNEEKWNKEERKDENERHKGW